MQGKVYREKVRKIARAALKQILPGISPRHTSDAADLIAKMVHAKLYGAKVDNVQSPIWRDLWAKTDDSYNPTITAEQILIEAGNDK